MDTSKTWVGLVVLVTTLFAGGAVLGGVDAVNTLGMGVQAALTWLVGASLASWVVRRGFWLATAATWLVVWAILVGILYWIAAPTGQASLAGILHFNAAGIGLSAIAAMLGASLGQWRGPARTPGSAAG